MDNGAGRIGLAPKKHSTDQKPQYTRQQNHRIKKFRHVLILALWLGSICINKETEEVMIVAKPNRVRAMTNSIWDMLSKIRWGKLYRPEGLGRRFYLNNKPVAKRRSVRHAVREGTSMELSSEQLLEH